MGLRVFECFNCVDPNSCKFTDSYNPNLVDLFQLQGGVVPNAGGEASCKLESVPYRYRISSVDLAINDASD